MSHVKHESIMSHIVQAPQWHPALSAIAELLLQLLLCLVLHTVYLMACNVVDVCVARARQIAARTPSKVHIATRSSTLQHTATHCNTFIYACAMQIATPTLFKVHLHTATHCNTLQHKDTCAMRITFRNPSRVHTATDCNTQKRTKMYCNTLRHTARHSNTLQDIQHIDMCTMRTATRTPVRIQTATNSNILHPIQERVCPRCSTCVCT